MGRIGSYANAFAAAAVALSFALYVAAFEPFGVAELGYVFAVPAILACRRLCGIGGLKKDKKLEALARYGLADACAVSPREEISPEQKKRGKKIWILATFAFSYLSWIAILIWLRHVYPPAGWAGVFGLSLAVAGLFVFPFFLMLPRMLPALSDSPWTRLLKLSGAAGFWVLLEWARSWAFTGFPWCLLAHTQWLRPASIQTAEFGGVWIVSFTLIFFNLAAAEYVYRIYAIQKWKVENGFSGNPPISRFAPEFYAAVLLALSGVWLYLANPPRAENLERAFTAGFVQTDFAGILKWDDSLCEKNLATLRTLTEGLGAARADLALWPEAATPPRLPVVGCPEMKAWVERLSAKTGAPILMGNMAYDFSEKTAQGGAFFVSPKSGLNREFYAKRRLVPFGEYVPKWCGFISSVVPVGNMKAGEKPVLLSAQIAGRKYKIGSMICYEDIFPALGREAARAGADILFVCTNDSWYGREGGAWQHAAHSAFQAVSTRLPLLRSSNNGLSAVFDQYGKMRPAFDLKNPEGSTWDASTPAPAPVLKISDESGNAIDPRTLAPRRAAPLLDSRGSIYFRGAGYSDAVFYKNFKGGDTFYTRHGDWFVALCAALFALSRIAFIFSRRR